MTLDNIKIYTIGFLAGSCALNGAFIDILQVHLNLISYGCLFVAGGCFGIIIVHTLKLMGEL